MTAGSTQGRPAYLSYLPPAYGEPGDGGLARLVRMFEVLMAGRSPAPERHLESFAPLDMLPQAVAFSAPLDKAIYYDSARRGLVFLGVMSDADKAALEALSADAAYRDAIDGLYRQARLETYAELAALPAEVIFPSPLDEVVRFEPADRRLTFTGVMSDADRAALEALSDDEAYRNAIDVLKERAQPMAEPVPGIEQLLDDIDRYTDPKRAPTTAATTGRQGAFLKTFFDDDFLSYLASWVALTLRETWPASKRRRLIQSIVPLYKKRGTYEGLTELLRIFVESPVRISEELGLQVGVRATVGVNTTVGGLPHIFMVEIPYGYRETDDAQAVQFDLELLRFVGENITEIVDLEKPAHTDYWVVYDFPGFIVGDYSTVGRDTLVSTGRALLSRD